MRKRTTVTTPLQRCHRELQLDELEREEGEGNGNMVVMIKSRPARPRQRMCR